MPATRTVQNSHATGQGFASVPVLFSLPNVQPAIAAASSGVAAETTTGRQNGREPRPEIAVTETTIAANNTSFDSAPIVVSPTGNTTNRTDAWLTKLTSQMTNITIVVLLVAVAGLAYQNQQQSQGKKPSTESDPIAQASLIPPSRESATETNHSVTPRNEVPQSLSLPESRTLAQTPEISQAAEIAQNPQKESLVVEKGAIPLLLPPAPQESTSKGMDRSTHESLPNITTGPYGTLANSATGNSATGNSSFSGASAPAINNSISSGPSSNGVSANGPVANPFSLTSSKVVMTQVGSATATNPGASSQADRARWEAIETETPSLNTRDIILLRNGQRRAESGNSDPGLPRVESVMSPQSGSRVISSSNGGTPVMTGQSYPPIAPQYEPISMPKPTPSRITQPSTDASQKPAQKQYIPLGAVLPHSNEANGFENRNP